MAEYVERQRESLNAQIGGTSFNIDYLNFFDSKHNPLRARIATEAILRKLTQGETISAEHSNPLGVQAVPNLEVGATWAIGQGLEKLEGSVQVSGKFIIKSGKIDKETGIITTPAIERGSSLVITPIRQNGTRLVTERLRDGETQKLILYWTPEDKAQKWIEAERQLLKGNSR